MGSRGKSLSASARRVIEKSQKSSLMATREEISEATYTETLFDELRKEKVKFSKEDTIFITRDQYGKITWLEKGNEFAGLMHIQIRHANEFEKALGIKTRDIPNHIREVLENGIIIDSRPDRDGTRRKYRYKGNYYTVVVTGSNGFIITAHPKSI